MSVRRAERVTGPYVEGMSHDVPATRPIWHEVDLPDRTGDLPPETDVLVVGAGIAGLTTAALVARSGRDVTVLEAARIGSGVTGHTTAKISVQHGLIYQALRKQRGPVAAARYGRAQTEALGWIAAEVETQQVDCDFQRRDSYLFTTQRSGHRSLLVESSAAEESGLVGEVVGQVDLPFEVTGALRTPDQAQFHPVKWLGHLADVVEHAGGLVREGVRVIGVPLLDGRDEVTEVYTARGTVRAREVVIATHYPILDRSAYFTRLTPVRDLVVAGPVTGSAPSGMFLSVDADSHSVRSIIGADGRPGLVVGGRHHRPGARGDVAGDYEALADWAQRDLGLRQVTHRWSAHDLTTPDRVPLVGRYAPWNRHLWVATGFGLWGMTNGTAAGHLLHDLLLDTADPDMASLFDPLRLPRPFAVPHLAHEAATVGAHLVGGVGRAVVTGLSVDDLAPGTARVGRVGPRVVAAYRSPDGQVRAVSARCTHLGCTVAFNNAEQTWDCPCHGSRFALDGAVLQGPATEPLRRIDPSGGGDPSPSD